MITKIVLTGGPCAGKTTTNERIEEFFSKVGYAVFTLPEAATLFIEAGAEFLTQDPRLYFEIHRSMMNFLLQMEDSFYEIAKATGKPALVVNDRGAMDISAYKETRGLASVVESRRQDRGVDGPLQGRFPSLYQCKRGS